MENQNDRSIKILESPEEMSAVEQLQRHVWPGIETDVVPAHVLIASIHNGGLLIGAFIEEELVGFVFGFPGLYYTPDGPRPKHTLRFSHGPIRTSRRRRRNARLNNNRLNIRHMGNANSPLLPLQRHDHKRFSFINSIQKIPLQTQKINKKKEKLN